MNNQKESNAIPIAQFKTARNTLKIHHRFEQTQNIQLIIITNSGKSRIHNEVNILCLNDEYGSVVLRFASNKIIAVILFLEFHPVLKRSQEIPQVQLAAGLHSAENTFTFHNHLMEYALSQRDRGNNF